MSSNDDVASASAVDAQGFGEQPVTELDSVKSEEEECRPSDDSTVVPRKHGHSDNMMLGARKNSNEVKTTEEDSSSTGQESGSEEVTLESGGGEEPAGEESMAPEGCEAVEKRPEGMSKNQWKKHLRQQKWEVGREHRRYIHRH